MTVSLGPFSFQSAHLLLLISLLIACGLGNWVGRRQKVRTGKVLLDMLLVGLAAGRIVFVATWFAQYRAAPLSIIDIRDGGFTPWAVMLAGLAYGGWRMLHNPRLRNPLAAGMLAGALAWFTSGAPLLLKLSERKSLPVMALLTPTGTPVTLAALARGRPVVVNLWASWCPPCRAEMPLLAAAQQRERNVVFVFVNQGEDAHTVRAYVNASAPTLDNVVLDTSSGMGREVGSSALPTTLFFDASGKLADSHLGALSAASLESKLARLRKPD
ncbi:TlpA disulfide reductase family protein [Massilia antarctica]|uniref:TlpA disulfide reductase family protein n=1 Tax=Massilia antarctica TaxID=2765360 RepID=UPI00226FAFA5|nr:TlpA disulfide reductase family protein [Massilia sp. H27-R4]MCY0914396.1 TlpA disulfide reductase family protein [Massilia sp. H27-R4]